MQLDCQKQIDLLSQNLERRLDAHDNVVVVWIFLVIRRFYFHRLGREIGAGFHQNLPELALKLSLHLFRS
jgi:hypothetical protein